MQYEQASLDILNAETLEEMQKTLEKFMTPGKISGRELESTMSYLFPTTDVMVRDPAERQHRLEVSERLRDSMRHCLTDRYQSYQQRTRIKQFNRALAYDTLLNLNHPEQNEEYERRQHILAEGTPKEKTDLLFAALHEAKQGYTCEKLLRLTDEEIAADFENLERLKSYVNAARDISRMTELELTDVQKKELLDFEVEFDAATIVFTRAKLIANPLYSMVRAECFPPFSSAEFMPEMMASSMESAAALRCLGSEASNVQMFAGPAMKNSVAHLFGDQIPVEDVTWFGADGKELTAYGELPANDLYTDGKLTAVLPDGTVKEIIASRLDGGGLSINIEERPMSAYVGKELPKLMDEQIPHRLETLSATLEKADPWYIHSSSQFKNVQTEMEKIRKEFRAMGAQPTQFQQDRLRTQLQQLDAACNAYLDLKQGKDRMNDRERLRLTAVEDIHAFAQQQLNRLGIMTRYADSLENTQEKEAFRQAYSAEHREENQQRMDEQSAQADAFQRPEPMPGAQRPKASMYERMLKAKSYQNIDCPPSVQCGDTMKKLQVNLNGALEHLFTAAEKKSLNPVEQAKLGRDMAALTVFHLVLTERGGSNFTGNAGPIEQALAKNADAVIDSVAKLPQFANCIGEITPQRVESFLMKDGARNVSRELIEHGLNQAKAPVQSVPGKSVQRDIQNLMKK